MSRVSLALVHADLESAMAWPFGVMRRTQPLWQQPGFVLCADSQGVSCGRGAFATHRMFAWSAVRRIGTYKVDLVTTDLICLVFETSSSCIELNEEQPGWNRVIEEMERAFPVIPKSWLDEVMKPPFKENRRVLYEAR